ncbi:MAG: nucleotidyltransferase [Rhizobiales bacterium]|nr:nucleotidyltransferase [Hyphomicrobiales bacterium]
MNDLWSNPPLGPTAPVGEILLAGTAIRIELPPSLHQLAVDRYEAMRKHIERPDSPLHDRVRIFYPQGSMAIRATIKSRRRVDGFDIDIVAELILPLSLTPAQVLDLLFEAINGPPGSKYHGMVERQTRCVTVYYADGMHLDVTPTIIINEHDPRLSCLHHAKPEEPPSKHERRLMNSYAFCEWFNVLTPADIRFAQAYAKRAAAFDQLVIRADADVKPVPTHSTIEGGKSATVVALQLLKRNRNLRYEKRKGMRLPPSVMMAKIAAETSAPGASIAGALEAIASAIQMTLETAEREVRLVEVKNPKCADEHFTDRWPENRDAQRLYIEDLKLLRKQLAALMSDRLMLDEKRDLLVEMFGEGPAQSTVDEYAASIGKAVRTGDRFVSPIGRVLPAAAAAPFILKSGPAQPRPHTFYGTRWSKE